MSKRKYASVRHRELRAKYATVIASGNGWCAETLCLYPTRWIQPGDSWDLAHTDDGLNYKGPAHSHCNRSDGARRRDQRKQQRRRRRL